MRSGAVRTSKKTTRLHGNDKSVDAVEGNNRCSQ
jgi:hypothetical protein